MSEGDTIELFKTPCLKGLYIPNHYEAFIDEARNVLS